MPQSPDIRSVLASGADNDVQVSRATHAVCAPRFGSSVARQSTPLDSTSWDRISTTKTSSLLTCSWRQVSGPQGLIRVQFLHIIDPVAILPFYLSLWTDLSLVRVICLLRVLSWPQAG